MAHWCKFVLAQIFDVTVRHNCIASRLPEKGLKVKVGLRFSSHRTRKYHQWTAKNQVLKLELDNQGMEWKILIGTNLNLSSQYVCLSSQIEDNIILNAYKNGLVLRLYQEFVPVFHFISV